LSDPEIAGYVTLLLARRRQAPDRQDLIGPKLRHAVQLASAPMRAPMPSAIS
jgi:hypothetical protein